MMQVLSPESSATHNSFVSTFSAYNCLIPLVVSPSHCPTRSKNDVAKSRDCTVDEPVVEAMVSRLRLSSWIDFVKSAKKPKVLRVCTEPSGLKYASWGLVEAAWSAIRPQYLVLVVSLLYLYETALSCLSMVRPPSPFCSGLMSCLYRAAETAQVSPAWVVISKVVGSIQTELSVPATAERPFRATVPTTERVRQGVVEAIPTLPLLRILIDSVAPAFPTKNLIKSVVPAPEVDCRVRPEPAAEPP